MNGVTSSSKPLGCGVPQGSVGGPTLFSIYLIGLRKIFQRHSVRYHLYADDIQVFVSFPPHQIQASHALRCLENCIIDIDAWMRSNSLFLNHSKCEFILFGSKSHLNKLDINCISIVGNDIPLSKSCRNLGVMFDSHMAMSDQITNISKSVRYQLRNIGFIRKYLTRSATEKLVHALISSRLDFGNGLFFNLPNSQIAQLQKLQNAAARIVSLSSKRSHITPILKSLHWLPVQERIRFKILLLVYHVIEGTAPDYNVCLFRQYQPSRTLRSSTSGLLHIPFSRKSWGERAFAHAGPTLWNSLPRELKDSSSITSFRSNLKSYLFSSAF